jgi:hypothetical protein
MSAGAGAGSASVSTSRGKGSGTRQQGNRGYGCVVEAHTTRSRLS